MVMEHGELDELRSRQSGVIARWQVVDLEGTAADFRRMVRRGAPICAGVCVDHTGEPTWVQRAWAAVLAVWPAALAGSCALRAEAGPGWRGHDEAGPIEVAVDAARTVVAPAGVRVRRVAGLDAKVRWNFSPPRMRVEEAVLDVAIAADGVLDTVEALASAVRARCTTAGRLLVTLGGRSRVTGRAELVLLLTDLRDGTCSALEHGYLEHVERRHGLPPPERQFHERAGGRSVYRDAEYTEWKVTLELDGEMFHARNRQRGDDLDRDLDLVAQERVSVRLGWSQVFDRPCRTAGKVGRVLANRGWPGTPSACEPGCTASDAWAA
ncbi:hypothetical protein [Nocardioides plantarum]|uniref:DUF559 domain-containing protein n=1 Tax=Nocardioides plantarum TaxID=29299 RepID=A0ABV5KCW4_9ACTN|nr:hypothetical protein [Nocardioides plantarum]